MGGRSLASRRRIALTKPDVLCLQRLGMQSCIWKSSVQGISAVSAEAACSTLARTCDPWGLGFLATTSVFCKFFCNCAVSFVQVCVRVFALDLCGAWALRVQCHWQRQR